MKDKISIIVPIYNAEKYLKKCIDSVINQTYSNWELILIDDLSEDSCEDICYEYCCDKRIKYVFLKYHIGIPGSVRNIGIQKCTGKYITFLDADDWLEEDTLYLMLTSFKLYNIDWVIGNFRKIKNGVIEKRQDIQIEHNCSIGKIFNENYIIDYALKVLNQQNKNILFNYCWGRLYKTKIIKDNNILFDENLYTYEDVTFNFEYLKYITTLFYFNKTIYNYRISNNFNSSTFNMDYQRFFNYIRSLKLISEYFKNFLSKKKLNKKIKNSTIALTIVQLVRAITSTHKKVMINFYYEVVDNPEIRSSLKYYRPKKGESIIIPILIFLKLKRLLYIAVKHKSKRRYK